jgi:hypothetical protein
VRKFARVAVLFILVSVTPAFAGHVVAGGGYHSCECNMAGCIEDYPGECSGHQTNQQSTPSDLGSGTLLMLVALMLGLKFRA